MTAAREKALQALFKEHYDILVIGGGATGSGIALDAALRGFKTALVDARDFASGASSRSTKLLHGGVRYLEKAVLNFDWRQLALVKESLRERSILMKIAPHLTTSIPIILPIYNKYKKFYFWAGLKAYDWLSGDSNLGPCQSMDVEEVCAKLPFLEKKQLQGGIQYIDGQFDDARLNIAIIQTAVQYGATAANYLSVESLIKRNEKICGAYVIDQVSGARGCIEATVVVNATGCFSDKIRKMDQPAASSILAPSRGSHLVFSGKGFQLETGFLIPSTSDGRVIFALPWQGEMLVGTTDISSTAENDPEPEESEIDFLLDHLNKYLTSPVERKDITAAWSGIRPLYKSKKSANTSHLTRDFYIESGASSLYSIVGGKWTTYRLMAQKLLDKIILDEALPCKLPCTTDDTFLYGGEGYANEKELATHSKLPPDIASHLSRTYGTKAADIIKFIKLGYSQRLLMDFPYLEAEVAYALHSEFALNSDDILYRRLRLGFLDQKKAAEIRGRIDEIIALC